MRNAVFAVAAALALPGLALAQSAAAQSAPQRLQGTVTAVSDTSLTLATTTGAQTVPLLPNRSINIVAPITVDKITPGSYVATANKTQPDGTGVSQELRVYPPGSPAFNVNRAMDASGELMMTNGTVATAVSTDGGRMLTVDYGNGKRQIRVPTELQVVGITLGTPAQVKPGTKLSIATLTPPGANQATLQIITINKADLLP